MVVAEGRETSQTVDRALVLLEVLAEHGPLTSAGLARRTGLNRTVVTRLLATLERRGYVRRGPDGHVLGAALAVLGSRAEAGVRDRARPALEALADRFGETAVLAVAEGGEAVAVDQVLGRAHPLRVEYRPGLRHPLTRGAHGRAILAFADPAVRDAALAADPDPDRLAALLGDTRARGWAYSRDELQSGTSGLAVPLFDARGRAVASLGIVAPVARFPDPATVAAATLDALEE